MANPKYDVLLDTSNTKINRGSLPNCKLSRHTQVLFLPSLLIMMNFLLLLVMVKFQAQYVFLFCDHEVQGCEMSCLDSRQLIL